MLFIEGGQETKDWGEKKKREGGYMGKQIIILKFELLFGSEYKSIFFRGIVFL